MINSPGPLFTALQMVGAQEIVPAPVDDEEIRQLQRRVSSGLLESVADLGATPLGLVSTSTGVVFAETDEGIVPMIRCIARVQIGVP